MKTLHNVPHRCSRGMCPVNGIRNLFHLRSGRDWSNEFMFGLGQGGGFAYLRFSAADPPRQVYWGIAGPRQHTYLSELFGAKLTEIEDRTFKFTWRKACSFVDRNNLPIIGPLDMFHLPFYEEIYHKRHIPIHYLLLAGYDEEKAYVYDTDHEAVQHISISELELAWDVHVPGLGKKNRFVAFEFPEEFQSSESLIRRAIHDQCKIMLEPPVSIVGIPAMKKLSRELPGWITEFGETTATKCLRQVLEYLNSPPDIEGSNLTAGRHIYIAFLEEAAEMTNWDLSEGIETLKTTIKIVPKIAAALRDKRLEDAAGHFNKVAEVETAAYTRLRDIVNAAPVK